MFTDVATMPITSNINDCQESQRNRKFSPSFIASEKESTIGEYYMFTPHKVFFNFF